MIGFRLNLIGKKIAFPTTFHIEYFVLNMKNKVSFFKKKKKKKNLHFQITTRKVIFSNRKSRC